MERFLEKDPSKFLDELLVNLECPVLHALECCVRFCFHGIGNSFWVEVEKYNR
jgi:hypothetical protein